MGQKAGFRLFCQNFPLDSHQSCFICSFELHSEMYAIWSPKTQFLGYFGHQSKSKFWTLVTFSKGFHWFHINITSTAHCKYFQRCLENGPQRAKFGAILGPQISHISGLWSFSQNVFTGFTSIFLHMVIASTFTCVENMGLSSPICGPLWAPK